MEVGPRRGRPFDFRTQTVARNGLNQPVTIDGVSVTSDARGNLTSDGVKSFVYDSANRLTGTGSSTLSYDPLDRMTQMVGTLGARYLYDGDEIAGVVVASTGTTIANRMVRGPGADELAVAYQGNTASTPLWSLQDPQSSIIAITDAAGTAPYTLAYDEYGRPRTGNAGRLMYTGQLWMPDFGLYHYKARAYHPGLGRFMQTDPVGYEQGMNLYAYVGLDPMNATDPSGLDRVSCDVRITEGSPGGTASCIHTEDNDRDTTVTYTVTRTYTDDEGNERQSVHTIVETYGPSFMNNRAREGILDRLEGFGFERQTVGGASLLDRLAAAMSGGTAAANAEAWRNLTPYRGGIKTNGEGGANRRYYTYDRRHGEIEVFDRNGRHLGAMNAQTGAMIKPPVPGRRLSL